ncbi:MAG TPA: hypothetical protein VJT09_16230 [Pyrinomonadaceae bacterium]|nr:hypothetical protein [Pyrinomonadaceae bacterium]
MTAAIIFMICMLLPAIWWIWRIGRDLKVETRVAKVKQRAALRQTGMANLTPHQAASRLRAIARRADPWKSMTPMLVSDAFKKFYSDRPEANFDASLVSAAFEQFTEEMKARH